MRQYKTLIICLFFLSIFCFSRVNAVVNDFSLLGKSIYLDAGHGGIAYTKWGYIWFNAR